MNEVDLIRNLQNGNSEALKGLIEKYQNYVYSIVLQIVKKSELAEEITQDVFIKVHQKINSFESRSKFSTWLFSIAYRLALNAISRKNIFHSESDFLGPVDMGENSLDRIQDLGIHESTYLSENADYSRDKQEIIWKAIDQLNVSQGVIISLFYLQQFSVSEIADIMKLSENTVKTQLFRGRFNLRQILLKDYTPEDLL